MTLVLCKIVLLFFFIQNALPDNNRLCVGTGSRMFFPSIWIENNFTWIWEKPLLDFQIDFHGFLTSSKLHCLRQIFHKAFEKKKTDSSVSLIHIFVQRHTTDSIFISIYLIRFIQDTKWFLFDFRPKQIFDMAQRQRKTMTVSKKCLESSCDFFFIFSYMLLHFLSENRRTP